MKKITFDQLASHGPIVQILFRAAYPDGLTLDELRAEAPGHRYLRRVLSALEKGET